MNLSLYFSAFRELRSQILVEIPFVNSDYEKLRSFGFTTLESRRKVTYLFFPQNLAPPRELFLSCALCLFSSTSTWHTRRTRRTDVLGIGTWCMCPKDLASIKTIQNSVYSIDFFILTVFDFGTTFLILLNALLYTLDFI